MPAPVIGRAVRPSLSDSRSGAYPDVRNVRLFVPAPGMNDLHAAAPAAAGRAGLRRRAAEACGRPWQVVRYWLRRHGALPWFRNWLLSGGSPPEGVTVATDAQAGRCRRAWDYARHCEAIGSAPEDCYYDWLADKGLAGRAWRLWLYGGPEPAGALVVGEALQRLRHERTPTAACAAAGINHETYRKAKRKPAVAEALAAARANASAPGHPSRAGVGAGLPSGTLSWVWAFAEAARESECRRRAGVGSAAYNDVLRKADRLGVKGPLLDYLRGGEAWQGGRARASGFLSPALFVPSPLMLAFRAAAGRAAAENTVWALKGLPAFWDWFDNWTLPRRQGAAINTPSRGRGRRGGRPSKVSAAVQAFCHERYTNGDKLAVIRAAAVRRFGAEAAPKQDSHVITLAKRWAEKKGLPCTRP